MRRRRGRSSREALSASGVEAGSLGIDYCESDGVLWPFPGQQPGRCSSGRALSRSVLTLRGVAKQDSHHVAATGTEKGASKGPEADGSEEKLGETRLKELCVLLCTEFWAISSYRCDTHHRGSASIARRQPLGSSGNGSAPKQDDSGNPVFHPGETAPTGRAIGVAYPTVAGERRPR